MLHWPGPDSKNSSKLGALFVTYLSKPTAEALHSTDTQVVAAAATIAETHPQLEEGKSTDHHECFAGS